ncbi:MAG: hypothetical protein RR334_03175 [Clostridia bacterium]
MQNDSKNVKKSTKNVKLSNNFLKSIKNQAKPNTQIISIFLKRIDNSRREMWLYPESQYLLKKDIINKGLKEAETRLIIKNNTTYRAVKNKPIIEYVAESLAYTLSSNDDARLSREFILLKKDLKLMRKEINLMPQLMVMKLSSLLVFELISLRNIESEIIRARSNKREKISTINLSAPYVYGLFTISHARLRNILHATQEDYEKIYNLKKELDSTSLRLKRIVKWLCSIIKNDLIVRSS